MLPHGPKSTLSRIALLLPGAIAIVIAGGLVGGVGRAAPNPASGPTPSPAVPSDSQGEDTPGGTATLTSSLLAAERRERSRMVLEGEHFSAYVPFAARWPLEVHLVPHRQVPDLAALSGEERDELAQLYPALLQRLDEAPPATRLLTAHGSDHHSFASSSIFRCVRSSVSGVTAMNPSSTPRKSESAAPLQLADPPPIQ